ncbi:MAG: DinB family protein [Acidimicrobiales bacterium]
MSAHNDVGPPRLFGTERANLIAMLNYVRGAVVRKIGGVVEPAVRNSPVGSDMSLMWIVKHLARAETLWIVDRFAGEAFPAEWIDHSVHDDDTIESVIARYEQVCRRVDEIVAAAELSQICAGEDDEANPDLRWVLIHLIEETARHAGHADILRELIDGQTGR